MKDAEKQAKREWVNILRLVAIPLDKNTTYETLDSFYTKLWYEKQPWFEHVYQKELKPQKISSVVKDVTTIPEKVITEQTVSTPEQPIDKTITETVQDVQIVPEQNQEVVTAKQAVGKAIGNVKSPCVFNLAHWIIKPFGRIQ